jgi:hypothetical protein
MLISNRPETARADALSNRGIGKDAHGGPAIERDDTAVLLGCHPRRQSLCPNGRVDGMR